MRANQNRRFGYRLRASFRFRSLITSAFLESQARSLRF